MAKTPFPQRLFALLQNENNEVISWNDDGRAFRIHVHPTFCNDILPRYFRHSKFSSFQRQLNLYGFTKGHAGALTGAYHHPEFLREDPAGSHRIKRAPRKGDDDYVAKEEPLPLPSPTGKAWGLIQTYGHSSSSSSSSSTTVGAGPSLPPGRGMRGAGSAMSAAAAKALKLVFKPPAKNNSGKGNNATANTANQAAVDFGAGLAPKAPTPQQLVAHLQLQQLQQLQLQQHLQKSISVGRFVETEDLEEEEAFDADQPWRHGEAVVVAARRRSSGLDDGEWIRDLLSSVCTSPREGSEGNMSDGGGGDDSSIGSLESFGEKSSASLDNLFPCASSDNLASLIQQDGLFDHDKSVSAGCGETVGNNNHKIMNLAELDFGFDLDSSLKSVSSSSLSRSSSARGAVTAEASFVLPCDGGAQPSSSTGGQQQHHHQTAPPLAAVATVSSLPVRHWTDTEAVDVQPAVVATKSSSLAKPQTSSASAAMPFDLRTRRRTSESDRSVDSEGNGHARKRECTRSMGAAASSSSSSSSSSTQSRLPPSVLVAAAWLASPRAAGPGVLRGAFRQVDALGSLRSLFRADRCKPRSGGGSGDGVGGGVESSSSSLHGDHEDSVDDLGEFGDLALELIAKHGAKKALAMSLAVLSRTVPASAAARPPPLTSAATATTTGNAVAAAAAAAAAAVLMMPPPLTPSSTTAAASAADITTGLLLPSNDQPSLRPAGVVL